MLIITLVAGLIETLAATIYLIDYFGVPFFITIPLDVLYIILVVCTLIIITFAVIRLKRSMSIDTIEGIQVFLFFPKGTPEKHKTLEYHRKHLHHKLIVNFKTEIPNAYYMPALYSYGGKYAKKFGWVSEIVTLENYSIDDPDFSEEWCKKRGYKLNPRTASRKDLSRTI